jgi:hypothetical protein
MDLYDNLARPHAGYLFVSVASSHTTVRNDLTTNIWSWRFRTNRMNADFFTWFKFSALIRIVISCQVCSSTTCSINSITNQLWSTCCFCLRRTILRTHPIWQIEVINPIRRIKHCICTQTTIGETLPNLAFVGTSCKSLVRVNDGITSLDKSRVAWLAIVFILA